MKYQYTLRPKARPYARGHKVITPIMCKQANARLLEHGMGSWDDESPASDQTRAENDAYAAIWLLPHEVQDYVELHLIECRECDTHSVKS